ncbi:4-alpha-glucanotransferase [Clostridiaceae bacterium NSJ-31]|uniref:4-alpha-glucanotransferase n=1 Tax=Ligaoa zhengdingensis TaxID=2763658 RepID=A0A926I5K8_9FIRM|nr:4-alpha-glucanotransferase [Ligaoa zhengdingensis]
MRSSGILMHITSLPSPYGIGSLGRAAYEFVDFLEQAGQGWWQVLPITPAGAGNSPYSSYSVFAGNPLLIDLEALVEQGLLTREECGAVDFGGDPRRVDYDKVIPGKLALLKRAWSRLSPGEEFAAFEREHADWLPDYALYMALRDRFGVPWYDWEEPLRMRETKAVAAWAGKLRDETGFWSFVQYEFDRQWKALKQYANRHGVGIVGDIPIYVSMDSADVWASPELFELDERRRPVAVAGVPPDYFSPTGQLWGNPLYNWARMKRDGYAWWIRRVRRTASQCDITRIDHFRGFDEYYAVPYGDETAENGVWQKGPGVGLFDAINSACGSPRVIAEDLGLLTPTVEQLLRDTGYPGMKVLEFAFDSNWRNPYLPFNYTTDNLVVYTGTHDNDTACGWYAACGSATRRFARKYLRLRRGEPVHWKLIECAWSTRASLAVAQMQDFLGLGSEARMNTPSVAEGCWSWRALPGECSPQLAARIRALTARHGRGRESFARTAAAQ